MNEFEGMSKKEMLEEMNSSQRRQYRLSIALQVLCVVLAGFAGLWASVAETVRRMIPFVTTDEVWKVIGGTIAQENVLSTAEWAKLMQGKLFFSIATMCICIMIIGTFIQVCREIGRDNSFSKENAKFFQRMSVLALIGGGIYFVKIIYFIHRCLTAGYPRAAVILFILYGTLFVIFLIFSALCHTLSGLVLNAYEVKSENDLTI